VTSKETQDIELAVTVTIYGIISSLTSMTADHLLGGFPRRDITEASRSQQLKIAQRLQPRKDKVRRIGGIVSSVCVNVWDAGAAESFRASRLTPEHDVLRSNACLVWSLHSTVLTILVLLFHPYSGLFLGPQLSLYSVLNDQL
jgi:hypothetical protein